MLKNKYLILLILFLVLLTVLVVTKNPQKQISKPTPKETISVVENSILPSETVINFYSSYIYYKGDLSTLNSFQNNIYLTDDFKTLLKNEFSKKPKLNPILCQNEKPDQINVQKATISAGLAEVSVLETSQNKTISHVVKLKLLKNSYKIYYIVCN